ncbi:MAG: class I SAM-dependent methyltransferase [Bacteroidota bacterium]|jgi:ubiquinone/menaquinone biosynthesis C-methylase UbiE
MENYLKKNYDFENPELISIVDDLPLWSAPFGLKLMDVVHYKKNIRALDIGFGLGFPLLEIAMRLGSTSQVTGIDPWRQAHKRLQLKLKLSHVENVGLVEGVAEAMPFADHSFDLIFSNNGINNVQDLSKSLQECYRVAKNDAQFVFTFNLEQTFIEFYTIFRETLKELGLQHYEQKIDAHIYSKRKPLAEMRSAVEKAGFKIVEIYKDVFHYRFADGTSMLNYFPFNLSFLPSWKKIVPEEQQEKIFHHIEIKMNRMAAVNNGFTMQVPFATFDCIKIG